MQQIDQSDEFQRDELVAMAAAVVAKMLGEEVNCLRVISFREIRKSALAQYLENNHIQYEKYQLLH